MTVLLDLLSPYPILENLASALTLGDFFNLSKVNSAYRAALHGFEKPIVDEAGTTSNRNLRSVLLIGAHRTPFWENLKARTRLQCSEPQHKRGPKPQGCLICSMPVCEACIVKASFARRNENTFQNRHRSLCSDCWYSGNHHKKHPVENRNGRFLKPYPDQAINGEFCLCAAKDGILCWKCKANQNTKVENEAEKCYGRDCPNGNPESRPTHIEGRVCLWCSRQLPGSRSRAESRRDYDARHILARSHSSYDRPPEEEDMDSFEEQRMLELDALSRRKQEIRCGITTPASVHVHGILRNNGLDEDSPERWQHSEAAHRQEWPIPSCPLRTMSGLPRYEDQNNNSAATNDD